MGIAASVAKKQKYCNLSDPCDPFGALRRENNSNLNDPRKISHFAEFVKDGEWQMFLFGEKQSCHIIKDEASLWKSYGYKHPCGVEAIPPESFRSSSNKAWSESSDGMKSPSVCSATTVPAEYFPEDMSDIFLTSTDMKALIVGVLFPIFLMQCEDTTICSLQKAASYKHLLRTDHSQRLQDLLLRAAASIDASAIEEYLADKKNCVAHDLKQAIDRLPVHLMICRIDAEEQKSPIIYDNCETLISRSLLTSKTSAIGEDLHTLCSISCSPGTAQQLERAMFKGKTFKKCFWLPSYEYKLMGITPVFNVYNQHGDRSATGEVLYSVCVESDTFRGLGDPHTMECNFQIVEDILGLLPLLLTHSHQGTI